MADPDRLQHVPAPLEPEVSRSGDILSISGPERDLLCALSYVHLACGQSAQSLLCCELQLASIPTTSVYSAS